LSFEKGFWLGNAAKTLSDVGILPSKAKVGAKRGKKALTLEETYDNMKLKEQKYK
jgi:hypothetical protein